MTDVPEPMPGEDPGFAPPPPPPSEVPGGQIDPKAGPDAQTPVDDEVDREDIYPDMPADGAI